MPVNWQLGLNQANPLAALQAGFQQGQELRRGKEQQNALMAYASNPNDPAAIRSLVASGNPIGYKALEAQRERDQQAQIGTVAQAAAGGDQAAMGKLWGLDRDTAARLSADHRKRLDEGMTAIGNAAYEVALLPAEQRAGAWKQRVQYLAQTYPDLSKYADAYSPENLQGVLAQTGMTQKVQQAREPKYQAVPQGGYLENVNPLSRTDAIMSGPNIAGPQLGTIEGGYRFNGGDPSNPSSWEPVAGGAPSQGGAGFPQR